MIDPQSAEGRERLADALGAEGWVDAVAAGGPYADVDALVAAAEAAADSLGDADLDAAIAHHVRAAEPSAAGTEVAAPPRSGLDSSDEGPEAAIARGTEVYRQRFGRLPLIRIAGRSGEEVQDELQRRLKNDDAAEAAEAREQLRHLAVLRLRAAFEEPA